MPKYTAYQISKLVEAYKYKYDVDLCNELCCVSTVNHMVSHLETYINMYGNYDICNNCNRLCNSFVHVLCKNCVVCFRVCNDCVCHLHCTTDE